MVLVQQAPDLRRLKEEFVSNLHGTTKWEVFCVVSCLPLCMLIAAYAEAWVQARARAGGGHRAPPALLALRRLPRFWYEFGLVVVPQVLLLMSLAPAEPAFLLLFLLWGTLALKLWMKLAHSGGSRQHMLQLLAAVSAPRKRFVSAFRGGLMLATSLAILAVDFPAFPRRYAKAEGFGAGVMDVGVGAVVWAGGLVSAAAAAAAGGPAAEGGGGGGSGGGGAAAAVPLGKGAGALRAAALGWLARLARGVRAALPLVALGGARLAATAAVGYQAHVGEYGLHWNFFWTVAAVSVATLALPLPPRWLAPAGLALSAAHQALLSADMGLFPGAAGGAQRLGAGGLVGSTDAAGGAGAGSDAANGSVASGGGGAAPWDGARAGGGPAMAAAPGAGAPAPAGGSLGAWMLADVAPLVRAQGGFWAANKEGLGSLPGYWALHLLGAAMGHYLATSGAAAAAAARSCLGPGGGGGGGRAAGGGGGGGGVGECGRRVWAWVGRLLLLDGMAWLALLLVEAGVEPVSRRSANLPYVLWTAAQCQAWLLLCVMDDLLTCGLSGGGPLPSPLMSSRLAAAAGPAQVAAGSAAAAAAAAGAAQPASAAAAAAAAAAGMRSRPGRRRSGTFAAGEGGGDAVSGAEGGGAAGSSPRTSPASSTSSGGGCGTPERQRRAQRQLLQQHQQQQQHHQQPLLHQHAPAATPLPGSGAGLAPAAGAGGPLRLAVAFNRNMLALFLAANLATGGVNLATNTLEVGRWPARGVVALYMLVLCGLAVLLDNAGITLKL